MAGDSKGTSRVFDGEEGGESLGGAPPIFSEEISKIPDRGSRKGAGWAGGM